MPIGKREKAVEFNIKNLQNLKGDSSLQNDIIDDLLEQYDDVDDLRSHIKDILMHGCISGCVSSLITYKQTTAFYEKHSSELNRLLGETLSERGLNRPSELLPQWEQEDPLCLGNTNQNLVAWFGYEEMLSQIASYFEDLN